MHLFILSHLNNITEAILVLRHLLHCDMLHFLLLVLFFFVFFFETKFPLAH